MSAHPLHRRPRPAPPPSQQAPCPSPPTDKRILFDRFSQQAARLTGSLWAFALAIVAVLAWAVAGPFFGFSSVWQLVINTVTTIVTFLMVFLIQHTQNKDSEAIHLKLDELIRSLDGADEAFVAVECEDEPSLQKLKEESHAKLARNAPDG